MKKTLVLIAMVLMLRVWSPSGKSGIVIGSYSTPTKSEYSETTYIHDWLVVRWDNGKIDTWEMSRVSKSKWVDVQADK